jgi:membrane protease YdiL (CAAX protease family)
VSQVRTSPSDRRQLGLFVALTFGISWLLWLPSVLRSTGVADLPEIVGLLGLVAVLGPTVAAFVLVGLQSGRAGMARLLRRALATNFDKRWWIPTLLLLPTVGAVAVAVVALAGDGFQDWVVPSIGTVLVTTVTILLVGGGLEEFGWRGYALDRLQNGRNALTASLTLGLIWGSWHLPLFLIDGTVQQAIPVWQFLLQQMLLAVLYTWLYNNTSGSLLIAIVFHTLGNASAALLPEFFATSLGRWTNFALLLAAVAIIGAVWGWQTLNRDQPVPRPSTQQQP